MQNVRTLNQQTHQKTSRAKILTRQVPRKSKSNLDQFYPIWDFLPKKSSRKIPNSSSWVHGPRRARAPRASRTGSLGANGIGFCGWFIWDHFLGKCIVWSLKSFPWGDKNLCIVFWGLFGLLWGVSFGDEIVFDAEEPWRWTCFWRVGTFKGGIYSCY